MPQRAVSPMGNTFRPTLGPARISRLQNCRSLGAYHQRGAPASCTPQNYSRKTHESPKKRTGSYRPGPLFSPFSCLAEIKLGLRQLAGAPLWWSAGAAMFATGNTGRTQCGPKSIARGAHRPLGQSPPPVKKFNSIN